MSADPAPGRPLGRSGVFLPALLALVWLTAPGCDALGGGSSIQLDSSTVSIPGEVHEVRITGAGGRDSIAPIRIEARPGDAVRFLVADRRTHALTFRADSLAEPVRRFLEESGQLRGPPLVNEGAAWIVALEDAPAGRYPFLCRSHDAVGELIITDD